MRFKVFVPCVNRFDLLEKAIKSIAIWDEHLFIIDNSPNSELSRHYPKEKLITPIVPLSFSQVMNACQDIAIREGLDYFITLHNDAEVTADFCEKLDKVIKDAVTEKWGVIFTLYDIVCVYNTKAVQTIGKWDTNFPHYHADCDYFRRVRLKGYKTLESHLDTLVKHEASQTVASEAYRKHVNNITWMMYKNLYIKKWGGSAEHEVYEKEYNIFDL